MPETIHLHVHFYSESRQFNLYHLIPNFSQLNSSLNFLHYNNSNSAVTKQKCQRLTERSTESWSTMMLPFANKRLLIKCFLVELKR